MGSLALASKGLYSTGVSTDIHATFVKAAGGDGDIVKVEGKVINMGEPRRRSYLTLCRRWADIFFFLGKSLASTRIELRHRATDQILAFGSHTKFVGKAMSHEENVVFDETGNTVVKGKAASEWPEA